MGRADDLATLRLLCTSGIDLITQMPLLAETLRRLIPALSLSMIRVDERCRPTEHYSEHFDEQSHRLFAASREHFATRSADPAAFANLMANRSPVGSLVGCPPGYVEGVVYQQLFQRNGIHHTLDVALREGDEPLAILGIFRERASRAFGPDDVATVRGVYAHLLHACRAEPLPARVEEVESAMLIADRRGAIQWASPRAREWLAETSIGEERARLIDERLLPSACRELCRTLDANRAVPERTLPVPGGRLRMRAYALDGAEGRAFVGVQLGLELDRDLRVLGAIARGRLTAQQRRIAWMLHQGRTNAEIRAALEIGATTLKSYQKDLYRRLDVSGASELVQRLHALSEGIVIDRRRHAPRRDRDAAS